MVSLMKTEVWSEQNILTPAQVCGDVLKELDDVSQVECALYCLGQVIMCFMFEFNYMTNVCRLFSGIANPNGTHLLPWTPFVAYKGLSNCERAGYTYVTGDEGLCFKLFETELPWFDARIKCEEEKGRLLVLKTSRHVDTIMSYSGYLPSSFWIGLSDPNKDGNWKWIDGTAFNSSVWHNILIDGQAGNYPGEHDTADCIRIKWSTQYLHDVNCKGVDRFVCERPQLL
ncbi:hepatic lectin-like [Ylistrum balloti]|uniref:hepatic lectin-like n=1 Tax=Ylistrum balloti TaxID=509963 RepID=UPI002905F538|nr:hepatic lectin-like [Ylistrum balloti]